MKKIQITFKDPATKLPIVRADVTWKLTKNEDPAADIISSDTTSILDGLLVPPDVDERDLTTRGTSPGAISKYPQIWLHWSVPGYESGKVNILLQRSPMGVVQMLKNHVAAPVAVAASGTEIKNEERNWLTYESLFNKVEFRKPNCKFDLMLYLIPMNKITIWLSEDISDSDVQTFTNAFFPDFEPEVIKRIASAFWPWRKENDALLTELYGASYFTCTPRVADSSRETMIVYLEPYAVLPYNRYDNTVSSFACGTKNHPGMNLLKVKAKTWNAWKTASRSCVMQLPAEPTKPRADVWIAGATARNLAEPWSDWAYNDTHRKEGFENLQNEPFSLQTHRERAYSIKTGVEYVGKNFQGGGNHKDVIGDWLIGCLRSDYISQVHRELKPPRDRLTILTELITITEKQTRQHTESGCMAYKEGIQVRKISDLRPDKFYLAPLNVPFVGLDLKKFWPEYHFFNDTAPRGVAVATPDERKDWSEFWKIAFAAQLGTAKALLMLRYGMQILNPNQQNFLIEFENGDDGKVRPTGTIAVRDLADASIHREAAWALFDLPGLPPQDPGGKQGLADPRVPTFEFEFTPNRMKEFGFDNQDDQETGTTPKKFGPPGTQFLWQRFSAYVNLDKGSDVQNHPVLSDKIDKQKATTVYKNLITAMSDWGMAHNKSYIACVESHLGRNFTDIDWSRCPNPSRLQNIATIGEARIDIQPTIGRFTPGSGDLAVSNITMGPLSAEEKLVVKSMLPNGANADMLPDGTPKDVALAEKWMRVYGTGFAPAVKIEVSGVVIEDPNYLVRTDDRTIYVRDRFELRRFRMNGFVVKLSNSHTPGPPKKDGGAGASVLTDPSNYKFEPDPEYVEEIAWEEMSAKVIHDYLASAEGQAALHNLKNGWKITPPSVSLKLSEVGKPFAWKRVFLRSKAGGKHWTDLTDDKGLIRVYGTDRGSLQFCPQTTESDFSAGHWLDFVAGTYRSLTIEIS